MRVEARVKRAVMVCSLPTAATSRVAASMSTCMFVRFGRS